MFGNRRKRGSSNPVSRDLLYAPKLARARMRRRITGLHWKESCNISIYQTVHTGSCRTATDCSLRTASEYLQSQPICSHGRCFGFPKEPGFQCVALVRRCRCSPTVPANDSNIRGRCPNQEDAPPRWFDLIHGKLGRRIHKGTRRRNAGAQSQHWIDE
jgi:hypothetical protein